MLTAIQEIIIPIPHTGKMANLMLNGKNLIITGGNGSGKTSFIKSIYDFLKAGMNDPNNNDLQLLQRRLTNHKNSMENDGRDSANYNFHEKRYNEIKKRIEQLTNFTIKTKSKEDTGTRSLLRFHKAMREASISQPSSVPRLSALIDEHQHFPNDKDGDNIFENYLISLKTSQSYAISFDKDENKAKTIQNWFDKIECDLRGLFEDDNLKLTFSSEEGRFLIQQDDKDDFNFQTLSSGYSSILSIYADLIMRVEMWNLTPESIEGILFIDEIDAHLHVSLQKQILRFFSQSFPKVQFIVTTHSPFVVTSVTDAIIYDLSSNEQVQDVSSYSYDVILQEIFGVLPISNVFSDKLEHIENLINNLNKDKAKKANEILQSLASSEDTYDSDASAFIEYAKLKINQFNKKTQFEGE